mmetsp:Transcript_78539/g.155590  ORF Transcript_78539/g.155590 Transcript_78539/m.155590 type:complete len:315 (-) Transcript_78539:579-1523(-)
MSWPMLTPFAGGGGGGNKGKPTPWKELVGGLGAATGDAIKSKSPIRDSSGGPVTGTIAPVNDPTGVSVSFEFGRSFTNTVAFPIVLACSSRSLVCFVLKLMTSVLMAMFSSGQPPVRSTRPKSSANRSRSAALPSTGLAWAVVDEATVEDAIVAEAVAACTGSWWLAATGAVLEASANACRSLANRLLTSLGRPAVTSSWPGCTLATTFCVARFRAPADFFNCSRCRTSKTSSGLLRTCGFMSSLMPPASTSAVPVDIEEKKRPTLSAALRSFHVSEMSSDLSAAARCASVRSSEDRLSGSVIRGPSRGSTPTS